MFVGLFRRFGFAAVVASGLALMALVVVGKTLLGGEDNAKAAQTGQGPGRGGDAPEIIAVAAQMHAFSDALQALGTAQARESIVLTPKAPDTIRRIRFDSGQRVARGQVLVEMSSAEQVADVAEARADNDAAQQDFRRYQELFNRGFASQARLDTARAAADAAEARLNAGGSRIADRTISAPFAGIVGLRTASPGQYVTPGDQIGTLDDITEIKLDFDVPETQIARLANGIAIVAHTAAFPDRTFEGVIQNVDSRVDPSTRTVRVRAMLPNRDEQLRPGMLMTVEVRSNPRQALALPEAAVLSEANTAYVYRVVSAEDGRSVERVDVQAGQRSGGMIEILGGLAAGDLVVTEGVQAVRPGQPVRVRGAEDALRGTGAASEAAPVPARRSR